MSIILEKNLLAHIFYNPEVIEKSTLMGEHFSDVIIRCLYTKLKEKHISTNGYDFINKEILPVLFESNKDIFELKDIYEFNQVPKYIFSEYDKDRSFDWMFSENIIKEEHKKRKYVELFEKTIESIYDGTIDTALSNFELNLRGLEKENPRDTNVISAPNFIDMYNEKTKEINELMKNNKPTYYTPSHPVLQKYSRMKKGWFGSIISGTGGGKTIALCQEAVEFSDKYNERVLYITDENSADVILTYMYCNYLGLRYHDVEDRKTDLNKFIGDLSEKDRKELERVFSNIDVIELVGIPTQDVRAILSNARNNDNPYGFLGIDSFEEMNIDSNLEDVSRQNQNAIMCERVAKDYQLILWVTAQLKTDLYDTSIEKMVMMCNHGSKTLIKKNFISLLLWWEFSKDSDGDVENLGFRGKINKCRSGGVGKIYPINQQYDYCKLLPSEDEIGASNSRNLF